MINKKEEERKEEKHLVAPTSNSGGVYSDSAITALFSTHIGSINTEKQLIWQRYSVMLIVNTIVFAFMTQLMKEHAVFAGVGCAFGLVLCRLWYLLNRIGWLHMWDKIGAAARFEWEGYDNPENLEYHQKILGDISNGRGLRNDKIYCVAQRVVVFVGCAYVCIAVGIIVSNIVG